MTLKARLGRLEPSAREAHRAAWKRFWKLHARHSEPVEKLVWDRELLEEVVYMNDAEYLRFWGDFNEVADPTGTYDLGGWGAVYDEACPEPGTVPPLAMWPHGLPSPPAEPVGLWGRLETLTDDHDPATRLRAALSLLVMADARTVHTFKGGTNREY